MVDIKSFTIFKNPEQPEIEPFSIFKTRQDVDPFKIYKVTSPHEAPTESQYEWRTIQIYTFLGNGCSASWNATVGNYTGAYRIISTDAVTVRIVARSGYWYDGLTKKYRGMMDVKTKDHYQHVGNDWTGTFWGYNASSDAAAYWRTVSGEIEVGSDRILAWGGYHVNASLNSGALTFSLLGKFHK